jgi:hypothetical protein
MRRIKVLGLAMLALFAFGAAIASSASATEPGLLFLTGEAPPVKISATGGVAKLVTPAGTIECQTNSTAAELTKAEAEAKKETTHVTLIHGVIDFEGCKEGKLACSSETEAGVKDAKELILVIVDIHFVALLKGTELVPGILVLVAKSAAEKAKPLIINCGGGKVLVLGVAIGNVSGTNLGKEDTKEVTLSFIKKSELLGCDTADTLCVNLIKEWAFEGSLGANFAGTYQSAEQIATATATISPMVLIDF